MVNKMKPKLIMMIGLVASGKSTKAFELKDTYTATILSSDEIRKELFDDINSQDNNKLVFKTLHERLNNELSKGNNVIYDATNLSHKRRRHFLNNIVKHDCRKIAVVMATPYNVCINRNNNRDRKVPTRIIERMYKSFYMPNMKEGFDDILLVKDDDFVYEGEINFKRNKIFNQHNPNHTLTLGEHMYTAADKYYEDCIDNISDLSFEIWKALEFHDIGKPFCMQFKDSRGRESKIAHYYNHENVGSYKMMIFMLYGVFTFDRDEHKDTIIEICNLIQYHMIPYTWTDKSKRKWVRRLGENFVERLEIMNKYDRIAH